VCTIIIPKNSADIYEIWSTKVLTSDQGSEFNNSPDTMLMEMLGIDHRLKTPYHPQVQRDAMHMLVDYY
jgi:hypothetical protein